ncbi:MAG: serine protein kinase RIO [Pseudomonadales bacterium]|jgi:RIO kinase 1|nr:serine protein kinase RIO [Pseudomonadales bacterium]MDP4764918.1 serine protein kinase RIO [Pseudomonadales bacterium]MDP4874876.1 serine protein kinase RIO [Pseudomonadales bacterium]MDP4912648.1 serine protein kinase RIO [Pseudomonadales bacterium]
MKIPKRLQPLLEDGLIDEVVGRLMSGKEADVFIVRCGGETRCAKVYKEAIKRGFKQAVTYQEGRKVRNTRRARAMEKGSKFGRQQQEETWQTAEVDALKLLASVGVRVPVPYSCVDGVLLMEMIVDAEGLVAPRLSEVVMTEAEALRDHEVMMRYVVLMLCAGVVHGDLSEFNVLVDPNGPVIIDLPQAVDAAGNNHAESMLARDVNNITGYYGLYAPALLETKYAKEIWGLYEAGELEPGTPLTGMFAESDELADVGAVLAEIDAVQMEELERLERQREAEADYD